MYSAASLDLVAADIRRQPELLADSRGWLSTAARQAARELGPRPSRIYLAGCGDSLDALSAVRFAWEQLVGLPVEAVPALTLSRYVLADAPPDALVVALSQSGTVSRVIEAARRAAAGGLRVLVVTGKPDSALAREPVTARLITPFRKTDGVPGMASFVFNLALLYELGAALAEVWGDAVPAAARAHATAQTFAPRATAGCARLTLAAVREQLAALPALLRDSLDSVWPVAAAHAAAIAAEPGVELLLGTGPNLATARFAARKRFEFTQQAAMMQETEEYAHDQIAMVGPHTPTLVFAPSGAASARGAEVLDSLIELGCPVAVVTERGADLGLAREPRFRYDVEPGLDELLSPLLQALVPQTCTCELARLVGGSFYGYADPVVEALGDRLIYESDVIP
jgi:glucosamine--fructose-6-phosphate aminotransferase (isomerizing)